MKYRKLCNTGSEEIDIKFKTSSCVLQWEYFEQKFFR